jgi:TetR/AcrR family transcriptional repressor of lmrAB and yxaGH operons
MESRQRMIETTVRLLRGQGLRATGMNQIVAESGAPRGSIYFHFPGGKEQLAVEALRTAGETVALKIREALNAHKDVVRALGRYVESYAEEVRESGFRRGCPIANAAMDAAATTPAVREVCDEVFAGWTRLIAQRLERDGFRKKDAESAADFILASIEGALVLCRARRSTEPLLGVARRLGAVLADARRSPARGRR